MKEAVKGIIKKVTLEMVYDIVDRRTIELKEETNRRFAELNAKIEDLKENTNRRFAEFKEDTNRRFAEFNAKIEDFKEDTNRRFEEVHTTLADIKDELRDLRQELRSINHRLDTIFTFFLTGRVNLPTQKEPE